MKRRQPPPPPVTAPLAKSDPVSGRELLLLGLVLAVGAALRVAALSHSAIEHFDEGVYASNIYSGPPDFAYPMQRFFGPPLLPALIETTMTAGMLVGIPPNLAALLPSFLAGCATIVAMWWLARSWFGPAAGIAAATLAALSDFHIVFSAAALTDVLLGLWLVLAVDAIGRSLLNADLRWAIGAGVYTGLAWWTKYNGWLPLAIETAALPVLWFVMRPTAQQRWNWLCCFALSAVFAVGIWAPYYFSLQPQGGYGPIAANHANYVVGWSGWLDSAARQYFNLLMVEGAASKLSVPMAVILPAFLVRPNRWQVASLVWQAIAAFLLAILASSFVVISFGAIVGLAQTALSMRRVLVHDAALRRRSIGLALVLVWWLALLAATPLYFPYLRLMLPYMLAAWLGAAMHWSGRGAIENEQPPSWVVSGWKLPAVFWGCTAGICVVLAVGLPRRAAPTLPHDRQEIMRIARQMRADLGDDVLRAIYAYGEPAVFFQLHAAGEEVVVAVADVPTTSATFDRRAAPTFLVVGPHAARDPSFQDQWNAAQERWKLVAEYEYLPSPLVWLDLHDPRAAAERAQQNESLRLYRYRE